MMSDNMEIRFGEVVRLDLGNTIPVPVRDYLLMVNKPQINGHELTGNLIIRVGDLENDVGYLTEETDPTVPAWAKQPNKPTYTAEEVGAMPDTTVIPIRISQLINDTGYYVKPNGGIPPSDLVPGTIPDFSSKLDASLKGARNGLAELDSNGMVPSHQLPSYVDDVKTYPSMAFFPTIGEDDKIYVDKSTNKQYRWSGDIEVGYVPIASSVALGETAQTAYRGDRGKIAYDHAIAKGHAYDDGFYKITVNAEGHIVSAIPVAKEDITALGIPGSQPDVSGFYTKPVTGIPASDLADGVIPSIAVTDVQINGTSILNNGVANIPRASSSNFGAVKVSRGYGIYITSGPSGGNLMISGPTSSEIKLAESSYKPVTVDKQHEAVYYALAKLAGANMASISDETIGVYPEAQIQAIQKLFGFDGILGDFENSAVASKAYAIGETFIYNGKRYRATAAIAIGDVIAPGTNCALDPIDGHYVRDTDYATTSKAGLVTCSPTYSYGINIVNDGGASGDIRIKAASSNGIKSGSHNYQPIVPGKQHESVFYGLAKLAGVDLASGSDTVGVYPASAKAAIQNMLGVPVASDEDAMEIIAQYPKTWEVSA